MANCRSDGIAAQIKELLPMERVARFYGFEPNRSGFIRCPFHKGDRTASLKFYDVRWKCFGCGKGGTVFDFVMELFDLSFPQSVLRLNADFCLGLSSERPSSLERSKILAERRRETEERERTQNEYYRLAGEHRYWHECKLFFAPTVLDAPVGYIHPLYAEAIKRLPYLEYWLDENMGR